MGGGDKRSRSKRKPTRYQHDDDGDDVPAAAAVVSSDKKRSVDEEALPPPQRQNNDGEAERRRRRSRSKPSRFQEDKQEDASAVEETTAAYSKKKPPPKKISKPAPAAKRKASARSTPKSVAAQNPNPSDTDPKKGSTRIKIKLSVGKNKGKKRKADSDDVVDQHITMDVKVRGRVAKKLIAGHGVAIITPTTLGKIATPRTAKLRGETNQSSGTEMDSVARKSGSRKKLKNRGANKASTTTSDDNVDDKKQKVPVHREMKVKVCVGNKPIHKKTATASFEREAQNDNGVRVSVIRRNVFHCFTTNLFSIAWAPLHFPRMRSVQESTMRGVLPEML